jgi:prepilin-type N-terminal cleavage/methylation domain-containing protein
MFQLRSIRSQIPYSHPAQAISKSQSSIAGFTAIELAIVVVMVGILAAIAAPGWQLFRDRQTVSTVNERLHLAMRDAQNRSLRTKSNWRVSMRELDDRIEWSVHRRDLEPQVWEGIQAPVTIEKGTTFASRRGQYYLEFNERGRVHGQLGRVTVTSNNAPTLQRCTIASTLLGTLRRGKSHTQPRDGHTCY